MSNKKSPQNTILKILGRKKAILVDELKESAKNTFEDKPKEPKVEYAISRAIKNLLDSGLAETLSSGTKDYMRLTSAGKKKLASSELSFGTMPVPAVWDGKWRIVILDLPEERKNEREALRYLLKKANFACIKNSVWVSPFPFEYLFRNIKADLKLTNEMLVITTDTLDDISLKLFQKIFNK